MQERFSTEISLQQHGKNFSKQETKTCRFIQSQRREIERATTSAPFQKFLSKTIQKIPVKQPVAEAKVNKGREEAKEP